MDVGEFSNDLLTALWRKNWIKNADDYMKTSIKELCERVHMRIHALLSKVVSADREDWVFGPFSHRSCLNQLENLWFDDRP